MSTRREARICVMQALYAHEAAGGEPRHQVETVLEEELSDDRPMLAFATHLFEETVQRQGETDQIIVRHAENWDLDRLARVDRVLLRMAVCELLAFEEIPPKVTIDEAIEISKEYSTDQSRSFINGVLDAAALDLERQGRLNKSGRGLLGIESIRERAAAHDPSAP